MFLFYFARSCVKSQQHNLAVLFTVLFSVAPWYLFAQERIITGVIRDGSTNQSLPFATIFLKGFTARVNADEQGKYTLEIPMSFAGESITVVAKAVSYKTEQRTISLEKKSSKPLYLALSLMPLKYLLQEVSVYSRDAPGTAPDIEKSGLLIISGETVQKNAGFLKDALRAIQTMPGAIGTNELSSRIGVRGGSQDENLVLINGTQVFEPYHIKYAASASVGVFNTDLVKSINLVNGGFSAEYGDRMSSVLNIQYRDGSKDRIKGQIGIGLTSLDALVEGPIGEHGSFIIGARQSFVQYVVKLIGFGDNIHPSFYDVQGQASYNFSPRDKLTFQFVHSGDQFTQDPTEVSRSKAFRQKLNGEMTDISFTSKGYDDVNLRYGSTMFNLRSSNILSPNATLRSEISFYDQTDNESYLSKYTDETQGFTPATMRRYASSSLYDGTGYNRLNIRTLEARSIADVQVSDVYQVRFGVGYQNIHYKKEQEATDKRTLITTFESYPDTTSRIYDGDLVSPLLLQNSQSFKVNGFVENLLQIDERLLLNIGGRVDYFDINQNLNLSPRVNLSYTTPFDVTLRAAWGLYYQSPLYPQLITAERTDTNTKAQRATHYTFSVERRFELGRIGEADGSMTVKIDAYHKQYSNLIPSVRDFNNRALSNGGIIYPTRRNDAEGFARGVDVFLAFALGRLSGWVSYGLLDSQERLLNDTLGYYPRFTDQRHALAFVSDYDFGTGWSAGLRFTFGSGLAYTPLLEHYNNTAKQWSWVEGRKNSASLPSYQRLDIRIDKRFDLFGLAATAFLDVSNVLNRQNAVNFSYGFDVEGKPVKTVRTLWPIIPTLGLSVAF